MDTKKWENSIDAANKQGTFVFWNHPCWEAQQPDTVLWWDEHTKLFNKKQ